MKQKIDSIKGRLIYNRRLGRLNHPLHISDRYSVDIQSIYEGFGYYIEAIQNNRQIHRYICWNREQEDGEDIYDKFDYIFDMVSYYRKCKEWRSRIKLGDASDACSQ